MVRRSILVVLGVAWLVGFPSSAGADGQLSLRLVGRPDVANASANFTLTNHTSDELAYTTYDGGSVHNGLERQEATGWTNVGFGYCGMGMDGEVTVAAGGRRRVRAYIDSTPGTYRVRIDVERRSASGTVTEVVVSDPFQVP